MRARSHSTGSSRLKWRRNRSKLQSPWWWDSSAPRMSNGVASAGTSSGSATKTNSASGSRNRRISQAHAARSMWQPARVAHLIASAPPEGGDLPLGCARTGSGWAWTLAWSCLQSPHNHLLMQPWLPRRLLDRVSWLVEFIAPAEGWLDRRAWLDPCHLGVAGHLPIVVTPARAARQQPTLAPGNHLPHAQRARQHERQPRLQCSIVGGHTGGYGDGRAAAVGVSRLPAAQGAVDAADCGVAQAAPPRRRPAA